MEGFVVDMKNVKVVSPDSMLVLIPHFVDVVHSSIPADFVDNDVFYFPVKNC